MDNNLIKDEIKFQFAVDRVPESHHGIWKLICHLAKSNPASHQTVLAQNVNTKEVRVFCRDDLLLEAILVEDNLP